MEGRGTRSITNKIMPQVSGSTDIVAILLKRKKSLMYVLHVFRNVVPDTSVRKEAFNYNIERPESVSARPLHTDTA